MQYAGGGLAGGPGSRLVGLLFSDYLACPAFADLIQTLLNTSMDFFTGYHVGPSIAPMNAISHLILYRVIECFVLEGLLNSRVPLLHDAGLVHLVFQYVQQYRFGRCWVTRLLRSLGGMFLPSGLQRLLGSCLAGVTAVPANGESDTLKALPLEYSESLQYYRQMYDQNVPYAVFVGGFVSELTHTITENLLWCKTFYRARENNTSRWRLLKPYLANLARDTTQMIFVYSARVAGAWLGRRVSREPTGSSVFWGESIALLALTPAIYRTTTTLAVRLFEKLEQLHPSTPEDEQEDMREREARMEEEEQEAAFRLPFTTPSENGAPKEDLYKVLGVKDTASAEEIKRAYRKAALASHPDRAAHDAAAQQAARERMASINEAYETLSCKSRRVRYDMGRVASAGQGVAKCFENIPPPVELGVEAIGILGLSLAATLLLCGQYFAAFHQLTGSGRTPLRFLGLV
ncbi:putative chaperone protein DNAj [Trypanosoma conorhini]|uniref:Putative chaperone protein DNAj n=1 Tax=Trypanosoma conorhini TaxID=83891 RepID=A0A3S5IT88_9TRYP|nr:putative chaperone protein DNAj [Trypanosoma conorhini]RNF17084.1 putative chaperone protein DNAj [Trypanosoma conorhini]